jgi:hypothetical protein
VAADVAVAAATAVVVADGVTDVPLPGALAAADELLVADEMDVAEVAGDDAEDDEAVPEPHAATSVERPATAAEAMTRRAFLGVEFIAEFSGSPRRRNLCQMTLNVTARCARRFNGLPAAPGTCPLELGQVPHQPRPVLAWVDAYPHLRRVARLVLRRSRWRDRWR